VQQPLIEPSNLAKAAMTKELILAAFAKGAVMDIGHLKQLIEKHFGKKAQTLL